MGKYHIAADSCTETTEEMRRDANLRFVPLTLSVGEKEYRDDEGFDQKAFLDDMDASPMAAKSACPSPDAFCEAYGDDMSDAYGITLSSALSGSYQAACVGAELAKEQHPGKKIHVFDSMSAASAQALILSKLQECLKAGMAFEQTVKNVTDYAASQMTFFVCDVLDNFKKSGRLSHLESLAINVLNIRPVLGGGPQTGGSIQKYGLARGMKQAMSKLADLVVRYAVEPANRTLAITQCMCLERAQQLRDEIMKRCPFKDAIILDAHGVSSMYAQRGGIVVSF